MQLFVYQIWVLDVFWVMDAVMIYGRSSSTYLQERPHLLEAIRGLCATLWETCWHRREIFVTGHPLEQIFPGLAKTLRIRLRYMFASYLGFGT